MKKKSRKARKQQREKMERAQAMKPASMDSKSKRRIHKCYHHKLGTMAYDSRWLRHLNKSDVSEIDKKEAVSRVLNQLKDCMDKWECETIITESLFCNEYYGTISSYLEQISDTTCRCSKCKKEFPIELMKTIDKIGELQSRRYKQRHLGGSVWEYYQNITAAEKIAELEKQIPVIRYRRLSAQEVLSGQSV